MDCDTFESKNQTQSMRRHQLKEALLREKPLFDPSMKLIYESKSILGVFNSFLKQKTRNLLKNM